MGRDSHEIAIRPNLKTYRKRTTRNKVPVCISQNGILTLLSYGVIVWKKPRYLKFQWQFSLRGINQRNIAKQSGLLSHQEQTPIHYCPYPYCHHVNTICNKDWVRACSHAVLSLISIIINKSYINDMFYCFL